MSPQITVDARILDAVLISIASATRFIERHDALTLGPLADDINEIGRVIRELRYGRGVPEASEAFSTDDLTRVVRRPFAVALSKLNQLVARADALASAAQNLYESAPPDDASEARRRRERLAHLISDAAEATGDAAEASERLVAQVQTQQAGA